MIIYFNKDEANHKEHIEIYSAPDGALYREFGDDFDLFGLYSIENKYLYTLCDFLDIDFEMVANNIISRIEKSPSSDWLMIICEELLNYGHLIAVPNVCKAIFDELEGLEPMVDIDGVGENSIFFQMAHGAILLGLNRYILLKIYIEKSKENKMLLDGTIFRTYALSTLQAQVIEPIYDIDVPPQEVVSDSLTLTKNNDYIIDYFCDLIKSSRVKISDKYKFDDPIEFLAHCFYSTIMKGYSINKCENCGKYFIAYNRSDTLYCDRLSPQDNTKTCKEYGTQKLWYEKLKKNESTKLCRNIYMAKQMLVKRNPDIVEYQQSFEKFKKLSKQWKFDIKSGIKTEQDFIVWLKTVKEKKVF